MKIATLKNKLTKMGIQFKTEIWAGNYEVLLFVINGKNFSANYTSGHDSVDSFSRAFGYDDANQSAVSFFYYTFSEVLRSAGLK